MKRNDVLQPNELSDSTKKSLRTRIITAIVALLIVIPCVFLGDYFFFALITIITGIGAWEIVHVAKTKYHPLLYIIAIVIGLGLMLFPMLLQLIENKGQDLIHAFNGFDRLYLSITLLFVGIFALFMLVVLKNNFTVRDACYIFTFILVVSIGMQSTLYIRYLPSLLNTAERSYFNWFDNFESCTLLIYGALATFMTDIGAYFVGVFFGKHKINERISPKKTYEGFFGGIVISAIFSASFAFIMAVCKHPILPGYLDLEHWYFIVIPSVILPFFATAGDFAFSAVKRHFDTKDFGVILPGHGGVCDRLDSWILVFLALAIFICVIRGKVFL